MKKIKLILTIRGGALQEILSDHNEEEFEIHVFDWDNIETGHDDRFPEDAEREYVEFLKSTKVIY